MMQHMEVWKGMAEAFFITQGKVPGMKFMPQQFTEITRTLCDGGQFGISLQSRDFPIRNKLSLKA